jgi:hypothetical protein
MLLDSLGDLVLATGALGTAAFGIVEALKRTSMIGEAGFPAIPRLLGEALMGALRKAYGPEVEDLLRAQYRGDLEALAKVLRQGMRIGLTPSNAEAIATTLGVVDAATLKAAATGLETGQELPPELRNALGRFELAADARIDAALALARDRYARSAKITASLFALVVAVVVAVFIALGPPDPNVGPPVQVVLTGILVGLAAVPLAPVAKDIAAALKAATEALKARS